MAKPKAKAKPSKRGARARAKGGATKRKTKSFMPGPNAPHAQRGSDLPEQREETKPIDSHVGTVDVIDGLSVAEYMFCYYISRCYPGRLAALKAGFQGARAATGVTAAELMRREDIRAQVKKFVDQQIFDADLDDIAAKMCRGDAPTKIVEGPDGTREEFDILKANELANKLKGRLKEQHEHSGPGGAPIPHDHAALSDEELLARAEARLTELRQKTASAPKQ